MMVWPAVTLLGFLVLTALVIAMGTQSTARYFWKWELPRVHHRLDLLESLDRTVLDTPPTWL